MILNSRYRRRIKIPLPQQSGSLTYNGKSQSPVWLNYDSGKMTMSGTTSSINAGTFTAVFIPKPGYCWEDGSRTTKNVSWTIAKAAGTPTLSLGKTAFNVSRNYPVTDSTTVSFPFQVESDIYVDCLSVSQKDWHLLPAVCKSDSDGIIREWEYTGRDNYYETRTVTITIRLSNGTLTVISNGNAFSVLFNFTLYICAGQNYNQSNTVAFTVKNDGVAIY